MYLFLFSGICTENFKFALSNPVVNVNGFCRCNKLIISSFTIFVAVAVNAETTGLVFKFTITFAISL